jgi:hypothetical protein
MEKDTKPKLPTMMSILLICSFINACLKIFSSIIMYFGTPVMADMLESGQLEDTIRQFMATISDDEMQAMMDSMGVVASINPVYHLINGALYIASLVGVVKMLKIDKTGLHVYSISQLCMIIASSLYVNKLMPTSPFWSDVMVTALFIVIYHLGFKQIEMRSNEQERA